MAQSKEKACFSPKIFTTNPKSGKRRPNKKTQTFKDSIANSILFPKEVQDEIKRLFQGEIKHTSFDCPLNLREAFKRATKANGTSECKILREMMYSYIVAFHTQKHALGNTISKDSPSVVIESVVANQYCTTRPRRFNRNGEAKVLSNREPKILFPEPKTCILEKKTKIVEMSTWSGKPVNLEECLDNWANVSIDERVNAGKYAQVFSNAPGAKRVLNWYVSYLTEKGKGS